VRITLWIDFRRTKLAQTCSESATWVHAEMRNEETTRPITKKMFFLRKWMNARVVRRAKGNSDDRKDEVASSPVLEVFVASCGGVVLLPILGFVRHSLI